MLASEDRLTEIMAAVLQHDPQLATWFCGRAEVSIPADGSYDVSTQVWLNESLRPDLHITVRDRRGSPIGRVFSEHKTRTKFSDAQRSEYRAVSGAPERWIAVVPRASLVPAGYVKVSWSDVALQAERIAREELLHGERAGRRWRQRALDPEVPSRLRVLHEFLSYLEGSAVDVTAHDRIEHLDVVAYRGSQRALETVEQLFRNACGLLPASLRGANEVDPRAEEDSWRLILEIASWADDDEVTWWAELLVSPMDNWREDGFGEPAFGAGLSFGSVRKQIQWPHALNPEHSDWARELRARGISVGQTDDGSIGRCFRTLYLSEVMSRGTDLDEQARAVADWVQESVCEIASLTPPETAGQEAADGP